MVNYQFKFNNKGNKIYLIPYVEFIKLTKKIKQKMKTIKNIYKTFQLKGVIYLILSGEFKIAYEYTKIYIKHKL